MKTPIQIVQEQAEDAGLWFVARYASEAYLQVALRQLHAAVEAAQPSPFVHVTPKPDACDHDFRGWREFPDGNGGEQVCAKCGMGAMEHTLRTGR